MYKAFVLDKLLQHGWLCAQRAAQGCSVGVYIGLHTFPIPALNQQFHSSNHLPTYLSREEPETRNKTTAIMTKTHHCPGQKKKLPGLPGNCRQGTGFAAGSCSTHQIVCSNIINGRYCARKHLKNEPCVECGYASECDFGFSKPRRIERSYTSERDFGSSKSRGQIYQGKQKK